MAQSSSSVFQVLLVASIFFASLIETAFPIKKLQMLDGSQMSRISEVQALHDNFEPDASEVNGILNRLKTDMVGGTRLHIDKNIFTWTVKSFSTKLYHKYVDIELERAFREYSEHANLTFIKKPRNQKVDIQIKFGYHYHGCRYLFDGEGSVLGHAFLPYGDPLGNIDMDIHFDDSENWSINKTTGTNFYQVALHEVGHSLGLVHTSIKESIMYPVNVGTYDTLQPTDRANLKRLYAKFNRRHASTVFKGFPNSKSTSSSTSSSTSTTLTTTTTPTFSTIRTTTVDPKISTVCRGYFDTIGFYGDSMVITARQNVLIIPVETYTNGKPKTFHSDRKSISNISTLWPEVAKYTYTINGIIDTNEKTYIFSGNRFWLVNGREMYENFPIHGQYVSRIGLPRWARVSTAFKSSYDDKIYIFITNRFYTLDETKGTYGEVNEGQYTYYRWPYNRTPKAILSYANGTAIFFEGNHYTMYKPKQFYGQQKYLQTNSHVIPGCN